MHTQCVSINVIFEKYSMFCNEKEDPEDSSFQKSETLHDEHPENDKNDLADETEPKRVTKVFSDSYWQNAMQEEINQIEKNKTWELVSRPHEKMS